MKNRYNQNSLQGFHYTFLLVTMVTFWTVLDTFEVFSIWSRQYLDKFSVKSTQCFVLNFQCLVLTYHSDQFRLTTVFSADLPVRSADLPEFSADLPQCLALTYQSLVQIYYSA